MIVCDECRKEIPSGQFYRLVNPTKYDAPHRFAEFDTEECRDQYQRRLGEKQVKA